MLMNWFIYTEFLFSQNNILNTYVIVIWQKKIDIKTWKINRWETQSIQLQKQIFQMQHLNIVACECKSSAYDLTSTEPGKAF